MHREKKRNNKKEFSRSFSKSSYQQTMHTATILFIRKIVLELILVMLISYFLFIILFLAGRLWYELFWSAPREAPVALALGPGAYRMCVCLCVCEGLSHTPFFIPRLCTVSMYSIDSSNPFRIYQVYWTSCWFFCFFIIPYLCTVSVCCATRRSCSWPRCVSCACLPHSFFYLICV